MAGGGGTLGELGEGILGLLRSFRECDGVQIYGEVDDRRI